MAAAEYWPQSSGYPIFDPLQANRGPQRAANHVQLSIKYFYSSHHLWWYYRCWSLSPSDLDAETNSIVMISVHTLLRNCVGLCWQTEHESSECFTVEHRRALE
jgi:hypothetical protein